ncbi:MAG: FGGY-family carbohydrate kinase [Planctomycetota bacterium]
MTSSHLSPTSLVTGFDFSTGSVKGLAFDLSGHSIAEVRLPTDLWTQGGVSELNICQLEGQVRGALRSMAHRLRELGRLSDWQAIGISATHHTAGRIDHDGVQVRRAICWNDATLAEYHARGLERLGGQARVRELIGGPWAIRYSLSHLVKDEVALSAEDWSRTWRVLPHGPLVAGFMTENFNVTSVSSAASTGMLDLRSAAWQPAMLEALADPAHRRLALESLPRVVDHLEPVGPLSPSVCHDLGIDPYRAPLVFPTSDDQQAGLAGGGAVDAGQVAVILGNSAVVNSSASAPPATDSLDCMRLNWGPYLWMRCYTNGAQFLDRVVGEKPDWNDLESRARAVPAGCAGTRVMPFAHAEPSLGVNSPRFAWTPSEPADAGVRFRASLEALACLIALGLRAHRENGQVVERVSVSGGIARCGLMLEILASMIGLPVYRLESHEGPALGAAAGALAGIETVRARESGHPQRHTMASAVARLVRLRPEPVNPDPAATEAYLGLLARFEADIRSA